MQLTSMEPDIYDLDRGEITDIELLTLTCLFLKTMLNYPHNNKSGKTIFSF